MRQAVKSIRMASTATDTQPRQDLFLLDLEKLDATLVCAPWPFGKRQRPNNYENGEHRNAG